MKLMGYGIVLRRIVREDIQQIRVWRNAQHVRSQMFFQNEISESAQEVWFDSIDNAFNYYFIIEVDKQGLGVIYAKNVNPVTFSGEGGIFIGQKEALQTQIPALASMLLLRFCFERLGVESSVIHVKDTNRDARVFNEMLGYETTSISDDDFEMVLTKDAFLKAKQTWEMGSLLHEELKLVGEISTKNLPKINQYLALEG
jgi:RimJ/RimL family protein N-acetyltransferase